MTTFNLDNELRDTPWHSLSIEETFQLTGSQAEGLAEHEAAERLEKVGRNEIAVRKPAPAWRSFLKQFANFFVLALLFAAALAFAISFLPGESHRRLTALFILSIVFLTVILSFYEEYRAQKELEALEKLLVFKVTVLREAAPRQVEAAMIVPGDVLILSHGQRVPADARVIQAHSLRADESTLTGESAGIGKDTAPVADGVPLAERASMVFASTHITQRNGLAVAVRTGVSSEVGQIAATLEQMAERPTPFQVEVQKMARQMDNLSLWSNKALLWSYLAAVGLQLLALYTPLRDVFGIMALDWRAWGVMVPVVVLSSLAGIYMTRWILKLIPLWEE